MTRRLFAAVAVASVASLVATLGLWIRSYRSPQTFVAGYWDRRPHPAFPGYGIATQLRVAHCDGEVLIWLGSSSCVDGPHFHRTGPGPEGQRVARQDITAAAVRDGFRGDARVPWRRLLGFRYQFFHAPGPNETRGFRTVIVPYRNAFLLEAMVGAPLVLAAARRNRRAGSNACRICRYNLTGNTSGVCSECGTPIARELNA